MMQKIMIKKTLNITPPEHFSLGMIMMLRSRLNDEQTNVYVDCALVGLQSSHLNNSWEAYLPVDIVFNDGVRLQVETNPVTRVSDL